MSLHRTSLPQKGHKATNDTDCQVTACVNFDPDSNMCKCIISARMYVQLQAYLFYPELPWVVLSGSGGNQSMSLLGRLGLITQMSSHPGHGLHVC